MFSTCCLSIPVFSDLLAFPVAAAPPWAEDGALEGVHVCIQYSAPCHFYLVCCGLVMWTCHVDPPEDGEGSFLHRPGKCQKARRTGYRWALEGCTTVLSHNSALFLICSFFSFTYVLFFPLLFLLSFTHSLLPLSSSATSLQLLCCVLPLHTRQVLINSDATTLRSAWQWAACLDADKVNGIFLLLGSLRTYNKILLLSQASVAETERTHKYTWKTPGSPRHSLLPSEVSPLEDPTNPSTWLRVAGCAFGWTCIWFCAQGLGTNRLQFTLHKEWSVLLPNSIKKDSRGLFQITTKASQCCELR